MKKFIVSFILGTILILSLCSCETKHIKRNDVYNISKLISTQDTSDITETSDTIETSDALVKKLDEMSKKLEAKSKLSN